MAAVATDPNEGRAAVTDWGDDMTKPPFKIYPEADVPLTEWGAPINAAEMRLKQILEMQELGIIPKRGEGSGVFTPVVSTRATNAETW